jgi:hypothetical protein
MRVRVRATEDRSPRLALSTRPLRHPAPTPAATVPDDSPFGAIIGALVGVLAGVSLWALLAFALLLRRF